MEPSIKCIKFNELYGTLAFFCKSKGLDKNKPENLLLACKRAYLNNLEKAAPGVWTKQTLDEGPSIRYQAEG
jgi:hypothetical protein